MKELDQAERFKQLIKKGFKIENISLEFGIPVEQLKKWQNELEAQKRSTAKTISNHEESSAMKMQQMREKYTELLNSEKTNQKQDKKDNKQQPKKELSQCELQELKLIIESIEQKVEQTQKASKQEIRSIARSIIEDVRKLADYKQFPLELAEKLSNALYDLDITRVSREDRLFTVVKNSRTFAASRLSEAIEEGYEKTEDVDELRRLYSMLNAEMEKTNKITVGRVKYAIQRKISELQTQNAIKRLRNDIPESIKRVIEGITSGDITSEEARKIIDQEAQRKTAGKLQNRFRTTEEQEKERIILQIRTAIAENPDKYKIEKPEKTIEQMQDIFQCETGECIRTVITNLIGRKQFAIAKILCNKFSVKYHDKYTQMVLKRLIEEIQRAEISELVLKAINIKTSSKNDAQNFDALEMGLKAKNIHPRLIILAKGQAGKKDITLEDIWPGAKEYGIKR